MPLLVSCALYSAALRFFCCSLAILVLLIASLFFSLFHSSSSRLEFALCFAAVSYLRCCISFDGGHRMNDVHCALLASGQCIGSGFMPLPFLSVLAFFFRLCLIGLNTGWYKGALRLGVWSRDLLQYILHFSWRLCVFALPCIS